MTLLAPNIAAFLQQRLPIEWRASPNTCDSYAHAFRLMFEYASDCIKLLVGAPAERDAECRCAWRRIALVSERGT